MNNIFGTDGIRCKFGTQQLDFFNLQKLSIAIAKWILKKFGSSGHVLIAHDTRYSCTTIKHELISGLSLFNFKIFDVGIFPTNSVFFLQDEATKKKFDCALIISASHNQYQDNGIKIINFETGKILLEDEIFISEIYQKENFNAISYENFAQVKKLSNHFKVYEYNLSKAFNHNFLINKKIIFDVANGSTYKLIKKISKKYLSNFHCINDKPNGKNINKNCGSTSLDNLKNSMAKEDADLGIAFDGDGDRIILINKFGQIRDGDDILAILIENEKYKNQGKIVGTLLSNQGLEAFLKKTSKKLIRAAVGDKYVNQSMQQENALLGGEPSGHIIMRDIIPAGDGILTALMILETLDKTNNWELETFRKFPQININLPIRYKLDLAQPPISDIIDHFKLKLENGRIIVRYSGTENCLRIMVEESEQELAIDIAKNLSGKLQQKLC